MYSAVNYCDSGVSMTQSYKSLEYRLIFTFFLLLTGAVTVIKTVEHHLIGIYNQGHPITKYPSFAQVEGF
jgi:hypothetical protein